MSRRNLENTMLSERRETQKTSCSMISCIIKRFTFIIFCLIRTKPIESEKGSVVDWDWALGMGNPKRVPRGLRVYLGVMKNVLESTVVREAQSPVKHTEGTELYTFNR